MAKKMILVDPRMLSAGRYDQPPTTDVLLSLDDELRHVLDRRDMSAEDKVLQYNQLLQKHWTFQTSHKTPPTTGVPATSPPPPPAPPVMVDATIEEVVKSLPKTFPRKGRLLMERIQRNPDMGWTERGELVIKGESVPGTNLTDLVNDVVRHRKNFTPQGWQAFATGLGASNVPQDLVGHADRWTWMQRGVPRVDTTTTTTTMAPTTYTRDQSGSPSRGASWVTW